MNEVASTVKDLIIPIAQKYGLERLLLFGSMARGDYHKNSDYDFLITKGELKSLIQYSSLINDLEIALKSNIDVITDSSSDKELIETALREGILVYHVK